MNRNQLVALLASGTAAAVAWGAVLVQGSGRHGNEDSTAPVVSSTVAQPTRAEPQVPRAVPTGLRVPNIEPGRARPPRGGVPRDIANSPSAVGSAFVRTMWTYDTKIDTSSHDAAARAARWATEPLAAALVRPATRTTPQWSEWSRHDAYTRVGDSQEPTLGQDVATAETLRTFQVDVRVVGDDSYRDRLEPFLVTTTLVHEEGRWLVENMSLT